MRALRKRYRTKSKLQKVPLSLDTLLAMCRSMTGWPNHKRLSFNDLLFATASSIAFSAGLRGGEFFTYPKSSRPLLRGKDIMPASSSNADLLIIDVPKPKNRPFAASARTYANGSHLLPEFHPSFLLKAYRKSAMALGLNVLHNEPAFYTLRTTNTAFVHIIATYSISLTWSNHILTRTYKDHSMLSERPRKVFLFQRENEKNI